MSGADSVIDVMHICVHLGLLQPEDMVDIIHFQEAFNYCDRVHPYIPVSSYMGWP